MLLLRIYWLNTAGDYPFLWHWTSHTPNALLRTLSTLSLLCVRYTHTHKLKKIMTERFGSTCNKLPNKSLQAKHSQSPCWTDIETLCEGMFHCEKHRNDTTPGCDWTHISLILNAAVTQWVKPACPPQYESCCGTRWRRQTWPELPQISHFSSSVEERKKTTSWRPPWADEADGGRARALIAPCDSATGLQPISWQHGRKLTLRVGDDGKQQLQVSWAVQHKGIFSKMILKI